MSQIGPALPPGYKASNTSDEEGSDNEAIGPKLPPQFSSSHTTDCKSSKNDSSTYGPALPPGFLPEPASSDEDQEDDVVIGPMPGQGELTEEEELRRRRREVEARSRNMRDKLTGKADEDAAPKREEWMTELPAEFKPLGIGARKFRTNIQDCGDRSVWTDTPADRLRKLEEGPGPKKPEKKSTPTLASVVAREKALAEQVEAYNKDHRSESLMDMHKRKRKAEEIDKKGSAKERRPFDRDRDLEAPRNLVTPAKRAALMKDSKQSLDSKFQRGAHSFL